MSDLEQIITETTRAHRAGAVNSVQAACMCDLTWRPLADHDAHVSEALAAMLGPALAEERAELVERNRRLANQIVGLTDRVNDSLGQVVREAKVTALREAAEEVGAWGPVCIPAARALVNRANTLDNQ